MAVFYRYEERSIYKIERILFVHLWLPVIKIKAQADWWVDCLSVGRENGPELGLQTVSYNL